MNRRIMALSLAVAMMLTAVAALVASAQIESASGAIDTNGIKFHKKNFSDPLNIDNPYFPLVPGTTFIYNGTTEGDPSSDVLVVTDETKDVDGITARVIHDYAYENGELAEFTDDWYAQDDDENVWYMGEFTTEVETGSHEGSWEAGVHGNKPGIFMEANPQVGDSYQQEFGRGIAEDSAEIVRLTDSVCVTYGCFDNVLETKETTPLEPGVEEHKYFAPGVGDIKEQVVSGGSEILELTGTES